MVLLLALAAIVTLTGVYLVILRRKRLRERKGVGEHHRADSESQYPACEESRSREPLAIPPTEETQPLERTTPKQPDHEIDLTPNKQPQPTEEPTPAAVDADLPAQQTETTEESLQGNIEIEHREAEVKQVCTDLLEPLEEPLQGSDLKQKVPQEEEIVPQPPEAQPKTKDKRHVRAPVPSTPVRPENRGGRPREGLKEEAESQTALEGRSPRSRPPKPEIVCWKHGFEWVLAVEVPDEILANPGLTVLQNHSILAQAEGRDSCWTLEKIDSSVRVSWNEGDYVTSSAVELGLKKWLLFKLSGDNRGRRVKCASAGSYLVVVPDNWKRDEELSGPAPAAPELVSIAGYCGHYFDLEKGSDKRIAFRTPENSPVVVEFKAPRFELVGNRLADGGQDTGPLFAERPHIRVINGEAWTEIATIVVGEEGPGQGRWRTAFIPNPHDLEQDLPPEVGDINGAWYFLRFYDSNDILVESLPFRLARGLRVIRIHDHPPLPSEAGHTQVLVEFIHDPSCSVLPATDHEGSLVIIAEPYQTILTVPPDQRMDQTHWLAGPRDGEKAQVTIQLERIWWAMGPDNEAPTIWDDKRITLLRCDFTATSNKAIWVRLPRPRWADAVRSGFGEDKLRRYPIKVTESSVLIPLREFGEDIADRTSEHRFLISVERHGSAISAVVGTISPDVPVPPSQTTVPPVPQQFPPPRAPSLQLDAVSLPRLARVLTRLRRGAVGPLSHLIKEVRKEYPSRPSRRRPDQAEFVKRSLCLMALLLQIGGEQLFRGLGHKWCLKARLASHTFPETLERVKTRYLELNSSRVSRARRIHRKRHIA